jgi:hypothetical protein
MIHIRPTLLLALACAAWPLLAAAAEPACVTAEFTAEASFGVEEAPTLSFSGKLTQAGMRLRVDVQDQLTTEQLIVLADAESLELTLLFPDTLNGQRFRLAELNEQRQLELIREAIAGGEVKPPGAWKTVKLAAEEIDGERCRHYRTEPAEGVSIEWWSGPDQRPRRVIASRSDVQFTVHISAYDTSAAADPQFFTVPADYTISEGRGPAAEQLPPL